MFRREFVGTSRFAKKCVILNENDILFNYTSEARTVKAYAKKPIIIENKALGYTITCYLDKFEHCKYPKSTVIRGNFIFRDDADTNSALSKIYKKNRESAYYGSRMHFVRTMCLDTLHHTEYYIRIENFIDVNISDIIFIDNEGQRFLKKNNMMVIKYKNLRSGLEIINDLIPINITGYFNPEGIKWSGVMGRQRIGDWLPYDYEPGTYQMELK